jgi:hypothetical protein
MVRTLQTLLGHASLTLIEYVWHTSVHTQTQTGYGVKKKAGIISVDSLKRIPFGWAFRGIR